MSHFESSSADQSIHKASTRVTVVESFTFSAGPNGIRFKIMSEEGQLSVADELKHHFVGISSEINRV